jgi:thiol-disulfide isomerase/thioredoxin
MMRAQAVALETFRVKPVVINCFASWCDPCREEMPLINELASKVPEITDYCAFFCARSIGWINQLNACILKCCGFFDPQPVTFVNLWHRHKKHVRPS